MSYPIWITKAGNLGLFPENEFFEVMLDAYDPDASTLTYSFLAGQMPPGIHVTSAGTIQGVPVVTDVNNLNRSYEFTVRAKNTSNKVADRTFSITVTNIIPPEITPKVSYLGDYFDGSFFSFQFIALEVNPEATLTWVLESGSLPTGLSLTSTGLLSGFIYPLPIEGDAGLSGYSNTPFSEFGFDQTSTYKNSSYTFTIKVFDGINYDSYTYTMRVTAKGNWTADNDIDLVNDAYLTVDNDELYVPIITTPTQNLPDIREDSNFAFKFDAIDPDGDAISWGYILFDKSAYDADARTTYTNRVSTDIISFTSDPLTLDYTVPTDQYNFVSIDPEKEYYPTVTIPTDSVTFTYANDTVISFTYSSDFTITDTTITFNSGVLPTEDGTIQTKVIITPPASLPGSGFFDPDPDGVGFDTAAFDQGDANDPTGNQQLPPNLQLDSVTGWLYGEVAPQVNARKTYTFQIVARKRDYPTYVSVPVTYSMTVLGDILNTITWITASDLGTITNGSVSELSISAVNNANKSLVYSLAAGSHLPQGLKLLDSGLIVGRCSFEYFSLDGGALTLDGGATLTTFDNTYTFNVNATATDGTVTDTKAFTVKIDNFNLIPYENLYLKALTNFDQRMTFLDIVNNQEIFPESLMYRPSDPWFGRARDIRSLFLAGLNPAMLDDYMAAMSTNHFNKRIEFTNIKTARALDANFNVKYEVVYIELEDNQIDQGRSPADVMDLTGKINPWYDKEGNPYTVVYPNSFKNMASAIGSIGYENQGALPDWMTSPQENGKPLGLTRAVVLAYTVKDASKLIAYRLKAGTGIEFNNIDFVADRYELDNHLSNNFNITNNKFTTGRETTFDFISRNGQATYSVDYAVTGIPFEQINNRTVEYIQNLGGLDGVRAFNDGDRLIFAQQENYNISTTSNDGWNFITESGSTPIPGYLDNLYDVGTIGGTGFPSSPANGELAVVNNITYVYSDYVGMWKIANQRAGIWQISITDQVVTLNLVAAVLENDKVQINQGYSHSSTVMYYNVILEPGFSVPQFTPIDTSGFNGISTTRFDGYGTKFINGRDTYAAPGVDDKYLKFPKIGVFK